MNKINKPSEPLSIKDDLANNNENLNLKGQEIIKFIAKTLPHKPGVYQM